MSALEHQMVADLVAAATEKAADRVAAAAKAAVQDAVSATAVSAASAASSASQILGAVAIARLDGVDKRYDIHEKQDSERFTALDTDIKELKIELKGDIRDIAIDLKKQTRTLTLIVGGLIALSKIPDLLKLLH